MSEENVQILNSNNVDFKYNGELNHDNMVKTSRIALFMSMMEENGSEYSGLINKSVKTYQGALNSSNGREGIRICYTPSNPNSLGKDAIEGFVGLLNMALFGTNDLQSEKCINFNTQSSDEVIEKYTAAMAEHYTLLNKKGSKDRFSASVEAFLNRYKESLTPEQAAIIDDLKSAIKRGIEKYYGQSKPAEQTAPAVSEEPVAAQPSNSSVSANSAN